MQKTASFTVLAIRESLGTYSVTGFPHQNIEAGAISGNTFYNFEQCAEFLQRKGISKADIQKLEETGKLETIAVLSE